MEVGLPSPGHDRRHQCIDIDGVVAGVVDPAIAQGGVRHRGDQRVLGGLARRTAVGERHVQDLPVGSAQQVRLDADLMDGQGAACRGGPGRQTGLII